VWPTADACLLNQHASSSHNHTVRRMCPAASMPNFSSKISCVIAAAEVQDSGPALCIAAPRPEAFVATRSFPKGWRCGPIQQDWRESGRAYIENGLAFVKPVGK